MIALLLLFVLFQTTLTENVIELPLSYYKVPAISLKLEQENMIRKYDRLTLVDQHKIKDGIVVSNPTHSYVTTKLSVGTPPVEFEVMLNFESKGLWVLGFNYPFSLDGQQKYDPKLSNTSENAGACNQNDETFTIDAKQIIDTVTFENNLSLPKLGFCMADKVKNSNDDTLFPFDGVLGINTADFREVFPELMKSLNADIFSIEFDNHDEKIGGKLTVGGKKSCLKAPAENHIIPFVSSTDEFIVAVKNVEYPYKNYKSNDGGNNLLINPFASNTFLKASDLKVIFDQTNVHFDSEIGLYAIDCVNKTELKNFYFNFGNGVFIDVDLQKTVFDLELSNGKCALALALNDESYNQDYVLGNVLLFQGYRLTFDIQNKNLMVC